MYGISSVGANEDPPGTIVAIAVDTQGVPYVVNDRGWIHYGSGTQWTRLPSPRLVKNLEISPSGEMWMIERLTNKPFKLDGDTWI